MENKQTFSAVARIFVVVSALVLAGCGGGSSYSVSPLVQAADDGDYDKVKQLLENGADVNAKTKYGWTPLQWAADGDIARLLIEKGADVNAKDEDGYTPLHFSADGDVARLLIEKGADVNAKGEDGETPLHWAAFAGTEVSGRVDAAEVLLAKGANVNVRDHEKNTPLLDAVSRSIEKNLDPTEIVKLLLANGADPRFTNEDGYTAADLAIIDGNVSLADLINGGVSSADIARVQAKKEAEEAQKAAEDAAREARREARDLATAAALQNVISGFANQVNTAFGQIADHNAARDANQAASSAAQPTQQATVQPAVSYSSVASTADSGDGNWAIGVAFGHSSSFDADNAALRKCHAGIDRPCSIIHRFRGKRCAAGAKSSKGGGSVSVRSSQSAAESAALSQCNALGNSNCTVSVSNCALW